MRCQLLFRLVKLLQSMMHRSYRFHLIKGGFESFWRSMLTQLVSKKRAELWRYYLPHYLYLSVILLRLLVAGLWPNLNHPLYRCLDQPASLYAKRVHFSAGLVILTLLASSNLLTQHVQLFFYSSPSCLQSILDQLVLRNYRQFVDDNQHTCPLIKRSQCRFRKPLMPFRSLTRTARLRLTTFYWLSEQFLQIVMCFFGKL